MTSVTIFGRAWFYDDEPTELELWEHEFEPMGNGRSGAEWCREHLTQCLDDEDLRDLLGAPDMGNFQVLFKGKMTGWKTQTMDGDDWDQEFDLEESKIEAIPQEYMDMLAASSPRPVDNTTCPKCGALPREKIVNPRDGTCIESWECESWRKSNGSESQESYTKICHANRGMRFP